MTMEVCSFLTFSLKKVYFRCVLLSSCFPVYFRCSCIVFCYFVDIFLEKKSCNDLVVVLKVVTFALAFGKDARCQRGGLVTGAL